MISIPFSGSKKNSYNKIRKIVEENNYQSVFEPFGGSCVLSVNLYNDGLVDKAVTNDYDHFFDNYETYLDYKDFIVEECKKRGVKKTFCDKEGNYYVDDNGNKIRLSNMNLPQEFREILQTVVKENIPKEYWRYLTYGTNFTQSFVKTHRVIHLRDFKLFQGRLETDIQREFLRIVNELDPEHLDWKDFLNKYKEEIKKSNCLLILDPPYSGTEQRPYKGQFTEDDTVELIESVKELNCDFVFFNHDLETVENYLKDFDYEIQYINNASTTNNRKRTEVLAYVKNRGTSDEVSFLISQYDKYSV